MRKGTFELGSYVAIEHASESANGDSITLIVYDKVTGEHAATALTSGEVQVLIDALRSTQHGWDANGSPV